MEKIYNEFLRHENMLKFWRIDMRYDKHKNSFSVSIYQRHFQFSRLRIFVFIISRKKLQVWKIASCKPGSNVYLRTCQMTPT